MYKFTCENKWLVKLSESHKKEVCEKLVLNISESFGKTNAKVNESGKYFNCGEKIIWKKTNHVKNHIKKWVKEKESRLRITELPKKKKSHDNKWIKWKVKHMG